MSSSALIPPWTPQPQNIYIFRNANIVHPLDGSVRERATVKISNGIIESVTNTLQSESPAKDHEITIDLEENYLCPGLIDSHVHLTAVPGERDLQDTFRLDNNISFMRQPYVCLQMLRRGFTTVRDCGGASLALKEAISEGVILGPRVFIAGQALTQTGGHADTRGAHDHTDCCGGTVLKLGRLCDGVPECIKGAREEIRTGADFLKIMAGGGVSSPTDKLTNVQFTAEEIQAITTVAKNSGTYVTAHAYTPASIRHAIENGARGIEHGNLIDAATAQYMAEKGAFLTPTLITYATMASPEFSHFLPPDGRVKNVEVLDAGVRSLQIASEAGVDVCFGTDLLGPLQVAQTKEFTLRAQVLSPVAILQSATVTPARMLGQAGFLGQIKAGFAADLLILNRNPLEDIRVLDNPDAHLLAVIKDGRVHTSRWTKLKEDVVTPVPTIQ